MSKDTKEKDGDVLMMSRADFESAIKAAAEAAIAVQRQTLGQATSVNTFEERVHAHLGTAVPERVCMRTTHQPCVNPRNGARFTAVIVPSKAWKDGRVTDLIDYVYPEDLEERARKAGKRIHKQNFGGGDPRNAGKQGMEMEFLQWRYDTYQQADRRAYVGESAALLPRDGEAVEWKADASARSVETAGLSG
jgi:hypothetical protein